MDTELKKLKRVQLLQIMIELSEDCDALIAENAELRKQLERASRKSAMSSTMKVGSIAEAALQANGFFESAQNAADDVGECVCGSEVCSAAPSVVDGV